MKEKSRMRALIESFCFILIITEVFAYKVICAASGLRGRMILEIFS